MDIRTIIQAGIDSLKSNLNKDEEALEQTNTAINDAPSAMQSGSDTTRYQLSAVAKNQGQMMEKLQKAISTLESFLTKAPQSQSESIGECSIVSLKIDGKLGNYVILPCDDIGGIEIQEGDKSFLLMSSNSPMAIALKGKMVNDDFLLTIGKKEKRVQILGLE